jgi:hypothetical protein
LLPTTSWQQLCQPARVVQPTSRAGSALLQPSSCWKAASLSHSTQINANADSSNTFDTVVTRKGKRVPVLPDLAATLAALAAQCGLNGREAELARVVAALVEKRQQGIKDHGAAVAAYLAGLGIEEGQLGRLLLRCPYLFSWPVEQRAGVLFGQLMALGLSAAQAVRCFEQQRFAAFSPSFEPATAVLAPLLAAGVRASDVGKTGEQLLGELLVRQPSMTPLLQYNGHYLQQRIDSLLQLGLSQQQLVAAVRQDWSLPVRPPERLAALESVLQQELGADRQLWCKVLRRAPLVGRSSEDRLRQVVLALVAVSAHLSEQRSAVFPAHSRCLFGAGFWQGRSAADGLLFTQSAHCPHGCVAARSGGVGPVRRGRPPGSGCQLCSGSQV